MTKPIAPGTAADVAETGETLEYAARHFARPAGRHVTPREVLARARRRATGLPEEPSIPERLAAAFRRFIVND